MITDEKGAIVFTTAHCNRHGSFVVSTTPFADGRYMVELGTLRAALVILK